VPLMRANLETFLVRRLGGKLEFVGRSTLTDGTNPDLNDAIIDAVVQLGGSVQDFGNVSDADIQSVPVASTPTLRGLCELFALRTIWGWFLETSESAGGRSQAWASMSAEITQRITALETTYKPILNTYAPLRTGTLRVRNSQPTSSEI
jgi:hypothetical protein